MRNRRDASTDASEEIADCQPFVIEDVHVGTSLRCRYASSATPFYLKLDKMPDCGRFEKRPYHFFPLLQRRLLNLSPVIATGDVKERGFHLLKRRHLLTGNVVELPGVFLEVK